MEHIQRVFNEYFTTLQRNVINVPVRIGDFQVYAAF